MICTGCGVEAPDKVSRTGRLWKLCEDCRAYRRQAAARHREKDPAAVAAYQRQLHRRMREEALAAYGGKCACCGIADFEFLTFDHPEGGGAKHRLEIGTRGGGFPSWLRNNGYPEGFRVLCYNCNSANGYWGRCPHQE